MSDDTWEPGWTQPAAPMYDPAAGDEGVAPRRPDPDEVPHLFEADRERPDHCRHCGGMEPDDCHMEGLINVCQAQLHLDRRSSAESMVRHGWRPPGYGQTKGGGSTDYRSKAEAWPEVTGDGTGHALPPFQPVVERVDDIGASELPPTRTLIDFHCQACGLYFKADDDTGSCVRCGVSEHLVRNVETGTEPVQVLYHCVGDCGQQWNAPDLGHGQWRQCPGCSGLAVWCLCPDGKPGPASVQERASAGFEDAVRRVELLERANAPFDESESESPVSLTVDQFAEAIQRGISPAAFARVMRATDDGPAVEDALVPIRSRLDTIYGEIASAMVTTILAGRNVVEEWHSAGEHKSTEALETGMQNLAAALGMVPGASGAIPDRDGPLVNLLHQTVEAMRAEAGALDREAEHRASLGNGRALRVEGVARRLREQAKLIEGVIGVDPT